MTSPVDGLVGARSGIWSAQYRHGELRGANRHDPPWIAERNDVPIEMLGNPQVMPGRGVTDSWGLDPRNNPSRQQASPQDDWGDGMTEEDEAQPTGNGSWGDRLGVAPQAPPPWWARGGPQQGHSGGGQGGAGWV